MRRTAAVLLCVALTACGGDTTPLPPLNVGAQWVPLMLDTTGNIALRRMGIWIDTSRITTTPEGYAQAVQRMHMDMKMGGMTTTMQMRTQIDCTGKRYRVVGVDSMSASVKGVKMADSIAQKAMAQQGGGMDTTWRDLAGADGANGAMITTVCARVTAAK